MLGCIRKEKFMGKPLGWPQAAIVKFKPDHTFWIDTAILVDEAGNGFLETYYRNPELAGIWNLSYPLGYHCLGQLMMQELIREVGRAECGRRMFVLSEQGKERLA
jgi:hypothetical protein